MSSGFEISRSTGKCALSDRAFVPGDPLVVALVEREGEGFERLDIAQDAWEALDDDHRGGGRKRVDGRRVFAWWRAAHPEPGAKPRLLLDDDALVDLFDELGEDHPGERDAERVNRLSFRFVLALILSRKRLLKLERSTGEGLFLKRRGEPVEAPPTFVEDPGLTTDRLRSVMDRLAGIVRGDE